MTHVPVWELTRVQWRPTFFYIIIIIDKRKMKQVAHQYTKVKLVPQKKAQRDAKKVVTSNIHISNSCLPPCPNGNPWKNRLNCVDDNAKGQQGCELHHYLFHFWVIWKQGRVLLPGDEQNQRKQETNHKCSNHSNHKWKFCCSRVRCPQFIWHSHTAYI